MTPKFYAVSIGLIVLLWTFESLCSTLESGPGSIKCICENWKFSKTMTVYRNGKVIPLNATFRERVVIALRMIPPSRYARPVEPSQPADPRNRGEAKIC